MIIFSLFFLGFANLVYEILWQRRLVLILGTNAYSLMAILSSIMAGIVFGSFLFGKISSLFSYLKRKIYFFILFFSGLLSFFVTLLLEPKFFSYFPFPLRFFFSFLLLLIPSTFLGGSLPVVSSILIDKEREVGKEIGKLYGFNTFGGVCGILFTGFLAIEFLGIKLTALFTSFLLIILSLFLRPKKIIEKEKIFPTSSFNRLIYFGFFLSGFSALGYQFLWIRALSTFLINTTYSFSLILFTYLLGLALGGFFISKIIEKIKKEKVFLSIVEYGIGFFSIFALFTIYHFPTLIKIFSLDLTRNWFFLLTITFILILLLILPPTLLMGMTYPLGVKILTKDYKEVGEKTGFLQGFNTLGAIFGSLITGFFLLPILKTIGTVAFLSSLNFLFATFLFLDEIRKISFRYLLSLPFLLPIFIILFLNKPIVLPLEVRNYQKYLKILFYSEKPSGTVSVVENPNGERRIFVNGTEVISTAYPGLKTVRLMGLLPIIFHPKPETCLVIGYGMGVTTAILCQSEEVKYVEAIEICEDVIKGSKYFEDYNHAIYENKKVKLIVDDGRAYLTKIKKKYDIISCHPTHPIFGSGNLYTKEFFLLVKEHLKEDGIFIQYLPFFSLTFQDLVTIINTFKKIFPNTYLFRGLSHGILVGFLQEIKLDYNLTLKRLINLPNFSDLAVVNLTNPFEIFSTLFLDSLKINDLTKTAEINSDDRPIIEFRSSRVAHLLRETWINNMENLLAYFPDPYYLTKKIVILNPKDEEIFENFYNYLYAEKYKLKGIILKTIGKREKEEIAHYIYALKINPKDKETKMLLFQMIPYEEIQKFLENK